jgi:hypothetical protein
MSGACEIIGSTSTSIGLCGLHKDRVTFFICVCMYVCVYILYVMYVCT